MPGGFIPPKQIKSKGVPTGLGRVGEGMTDKYAVEKFGQVFIPMAWSVK